MTARTAAIVVAGGTGTRFGRAEGKQLLAIGGRPVAWWAISAVSSATSVDMMVVVCHPDRVAEYRESLSSASRLGDPRFVAGGDTRQASVAAGLAAVGDSADIVVIHDGARPLVLPETVDRAVAMLTCSPELDGVIIGHPSTDTLKLAQDGLVAGTPDRSRYWAVQTPQVFRREALVRASAYAQSRGFVGTDDASLVESVGGRVALLEGPRDNLKITVPEDAAIAEAILGWRAREGSQ